MTVSLLSLMKFNVDALFRSRRRFRDMDIEHAVFVCRANVFRRRIGWQRDRALEAAKEAFAPVHLFLFDIMMALNRAADR